MVTKGEIEGGWINQELGMNIHTLYMYKYIIYIYYV